MTLKTILVSGVVTLGLAACHHDRETNTPANNTYGTSGDSNAGQQAHSYGATGAATDTSTPPAVDGTGETGAAGVQNGADTNASGATTGNNAGNKKDARPQRAYNDSNKPTPSATNGTNSNTDSDMDGTGRSGTTKPSNPGTADQPDR